MNKISKGDKIKARKVETIHSEKITIPAADKLTHLQFRRFSGCPICNLHFNSFVKRHDEIKAAGINVITLFHSSRKTMLKHHAGVPFTLIADPEKKLYKEFGVETSVFSVLHPRALLAAIKGTLKHGVGLPGLGENPLGLPADILIDNTGKVLASKYGSHANDQWTVDELLALAK